MARVLGVLAALLWVAGIVVLILGIVDVGPDVTFEVPGGGNGGGFFVTDNSPTVKLIIGTVLVGVAGLLTAGLVLVGRGR